MGDFPPERFPPWLSGGTKELAGPCVARRAPATTRAASLGREWVPQFQEYQLSDLIEQWTRQGGTAPLLAMRDENKAASQSGIVVLLSATIRAARTARDRKADNLCGAISTEALNVIDGGRPGTASQCSYSAFNHKAASGPAASVRACAWACARPSRGAVAAPWPRCHQLRSAAEVGTAVGPSPSLPQNSPTTFISLQFTSGAFPVEGVAEKTQA